MSPGKPRSGNSPDQTVVVSTGHVQELADLAGDPTDSTLGNHSAGVTDYQRATKSAVHTQAPVWPRKRPQLRPIPTQR
jgi:hypothetical protein